MHHFTFWTLVISRINLNFIKALIIHTEPNRDLAQSIEYCHDDLEVLASIPTGGNFCEIYFALSCVTKSFSDNLTETRNVYREKLD